MKTRHLLATLAITALLTGSALGYTYSVWKDELPTFQAPSYATIIPTDSPMRKSALQGGCNGGFSPNPCIGTIPEPGTYALFGVGVAGLIFTRRRY